MVAANFIALLQVFFAGVLNNIAIIESEPRGGLEGSRANNTYLPKLCSFEVSGG